MNGFVQFLNYYQASSNITLSSGGTVDDRLTRGGLQASRPAFASVNLGLSSDPRRKFVFFVGNFLQTGESGTNSDWFSEFTFKPRPSLELSIGPSINWDKSKAQFLGRITDPAAVNTYGSRYLFASVDQTTLSIDTRVNYTFSPTLSLQVFAQPFVASGEYGAVKEFARPDTYEFLEYGRDVGVIQNGRVYPNGAGTAVSFAVPRLISM